MSVYGIYFLGECVRVIYYFHFDYKKTKQWQCSAAGFFLVYLLPGAVGLLLWKSKKWILGNMFTILYKLFLFEHFFFFFYIISVGWISCKYVIIVSGLLTIHKQKKIVSKWKCFTKNMSHNFVNIISSFSWNGPVRTNTLFFILQCLYIIYSRKDEKKNVSCVWFRSFFSLFIGIICSGCQFVFE